MGERKKSLPHFSQRTRYVLLDNARRRNRCEMNRYRVTGWVRVPGIDGESSLWHETDMTLLGPFFDETLAGIERNIAYTISQVEHALNCEFSTWAWVIGPIVHRMPDDTGTRWRRCGECGTPILVNVGSEDDAAPEVYCGKCGFGEGFRVVLEANPHDMGVAAQCDTAGALRA